VILNSSSAEFGRGGGAIANEVYKGGTNNWHGSGWDIIQPSALAAIDGVSPFWRDQTTRSNNQYLRLLVWRPHQEKQTVFLCHSSMGPVPSECGAFTSPILIPTANGVATLKQIETNEGPNANIDYLIASLGSVRALANGATMVSAGFDAQKNPRPAVEFGRCRAATAASSPMPAMEHPHRLCRVGS